ncbi:GGDEF domain-containing protein [Eubacteriaceae bacterium ES2]|nr:GGDEF domain-containing protein [Eubacteriaceae bacterium ES2]
MKSIDHLFLEIYLGFSLCVSLFTFFYVYFILAAVSSVTVFVFVLYFIYLGLEIILYAKKQYGDLEKLGSGYLHICIDLIFIFYCAYAIDLFYYFLLPVLCLNILIFCLGMHRIKGKTHGFIVVTFYLLVSLLLGKNVFIAAVQVVLLLGLVFFVDEIRQIINSVYKRNEYILAEIEQKNRLLEHRAKTDFLTDLSNHQAFYQELDGMASKAAPIILILFDIDDFKKINDVYGHLCGDYVIREVAQIIKQQVRSSDIAARYGGEEFAILLPETHESSGRRIAERIRREIESHAFAFEAFRFQVTVSAGICSSTVTLKKSEQVQFVDQADSLLYESKRNGKNRVTTACLQEI